MSWLFGYRSSQPRDFTQFVPPSPPASDGGGGSGGGAQMEAYRFDSSTLERAAAKELERSSIFEYEKEALDLAMAQEATKKMEFQNEMKKYEASIEQQKTERIRLEAEQRMKAAQEETKQHQMRAQYQDQLARKRYEEQLILQQKMNDENLRRQEELLPKQEINKATTKHTMELNSKKIKILGVELNAKANIDRDNLDINLEKIRSKEERSEERTALEKIRTTGSLIGLGAKEFLGDWNKIFMSASYLSLVAFGLYSAKASTSVASRYIAARLEKPSLVRETSRVAFLDIIRHPIEAVKKLKKTKQTDALSDVILAPKLEEKLRDIAIATKNTKKNRGNYRNILMYGPPGTGKTMFAKKLAEHSGMDYAIMTGYDVFLVDGDGVTAIHRVFDWASTSRKGLLLFIDEADAFLKKREQMSENLWAMLNAFLYRTGESNNKFMLVLASNTPEQFDWANMNDRLHEMIEFGLPGREERERLVRLYFDEYILQPAIEGNKRLKIAEFDYSSLCSKVADLTDGMSGRQLEKLALTWQTTAYVSDDGVLTEKMAMDKCLEAIKQNRRYTGKAKKRSKVDIRHKRLEDSGDLDSSSLDNCKSAFVNNL